MSRPRLVTNRNKLREMAYANGWQRHLASRSDRYVFVSYIRDEVTFSVSLIADTVTDIRLSNRGLSAELRENHCSAQQLLDVALDWLSRPRNHRRHT